jgi:hypothetical protein
MSRSCYFIVCEHFKEAHNPQEADCRALDNENEDDDEYEGGTLPNVVFVLVLLLVFGFGFF